MRALFKSMGYSDTDLDRPLIGIANSWNRLVPGHYNLKQVAEYAAQGILQAGGTPIEFGVIAACDGKLATHTWRSASIGNLGGWQVARTLFFLNVLTGSVGNKGGTQANEWNKFEM